MVFYMKLLSRLKCKLAAISMRFVAAMSQRFRTCSKLHATLGGDLGKTEVKVRHQRGTELHWNRSKLQKLQ